MKDFEFDKIALAIALGIFVIIFSWNIGNIIYVPDLHLKKQGYVIAVANKTAPLSDSAAGELPSDIDIAKIMSVADSNAGAEVFKKCAVCHTDAKGAKNKIGPNLWGIVTAEVARHKDFAYSAAMLSKGENGAKWSYEELYRYLYAPKKHVPGTKMAFIGIKNDVERANLIAYLRLLADAPVPLP